MQRDQQPAQHRQAEQLADDVAQRVGQHVLLGAREVVAQAHRDSRQGHGDPARAGEYSRTAQRRKEAGRSGLRRAAARMLRISA
nr:hypothetical protein GCM10020093_094440 [Planobispora longispora]